MSVVEDPTQTIDTPAIAAGCGFTVSVREVKQPVVVEVKVMETVPAEIPVISPVEEPMVATVASLLLHDPPASVRVAEEPTHTLVAPDIADGSGLTVSVAVAEQPVDANV